MASTSNPTVTLNDGHQIPQIGFGTWRIANERAPRIVSHAIATGYRHIDTAHAYKNEPGVGEAVKSSSIGREGIFVTTKLFNAFHGFDKALKTFEGSLERLGFDYVDLYLIHWPVPSENLYVETWKAFVRLKEEGRAKSIGVSNFNQDHLERIIGETGVAPAVNQIELHPRFQQRAARDFHAKHQIAIQSWSPLGQGGLTDDGTIVSIARKHGKTPTQTILRWHLDQGLIPLPRSGTPAHIDENFDVFDFTLDADDMTKLAQLDDAKGRIGPDPEVLGAVALP